MTARPHNSGASIPGHPQTNRRGRTAPSISFLLFVLAVIAAGSGALAWALVRPEPRTVEIIIPTPGPMVVHITGAVANPGVYTLPPGSRISDAIQSAGGLTGDSSINLAAPLRDGQQVVVLEASNSESVIEGQSTQQPDILLDLNTASPEQLEVLPNIGPARAAAIIQFRERSGPILFVDDLTAIDGIGTAIVDSLRSLVVQP